MSDKKPEGMFAKLAQQQAKAAPEEAASKPETVVEHTPPSPALPVADKSKRSTAKAKPEPVKGKRNHPDYCQANSYVPKKLRRAVEKQLLDIEGMDYSDLIEELLEKWLKSRGVSA